MLIPETELNQAEALIIKSLNDNLYNLLMKIFLKCKNNNYDKTARFTNDNYYLIAITKSNVGARLSLELNSADILYDYYTALHGKEYDFTNAAINKSSLGGPWIATTLNPAAYSIKDYLHPAKNIVDAKFYNLASALCDNYLEYPERRPQGLKDWYSTMGLSLAYDYTRFNSAYKTILNLNYDPFKKFTSPKVGYIASAHRILIYDILKNADEWHELRDNENCNYLHSLMLKK